MDLLSEKDFTDITVQDIADLMNVTRRTIYMRYGDKFDLMDRLVEVHIGELRDLYFLSEKVGLVEGTQTCFEYFEDNYSFFRTILGCKDTPYFRTHLLAFLTEVGVNERRRPRGQNSVLQNDVALNFLVSAYAGVIEWWINNGMPYPTHVIAEQVASFLAHNLS